MQITGKNLLSSAESLLRERREKPLRAGAPAEPRSSESVNVQSGAAQARLVHLQGRLSGTQVEFSREQARLAFLDNPDEKPGELLFNGQPLFPETDISDLRSKVKERLDGLERSLRTLQVEMENMVALGMVSTAEFKPEDLNRTIGRVDATQVSRLIR